MIEKKNNDFSSLDDELLKIINTSYLSNDDIKWLKSKRWFKRFIKIYARELKERYKDSEPVAREVKTTNEDIEVLDFTQSIKIPPEEIIEILDFTKTIDVTNVKDITESASIAKKRVKFEKRLWSIMIALCTLIAMVLIVVLINWYIENIETKKIIEKIYEIAEVEEVAPSESNSNVSGDTDITTTTTTTTTTTKESIYTEYGKKSILNINFDNLLKMNADTKGWIVVPGTNINYPFVQTDNNEYYLKHSYDKSKNKKGWVFLDYRNNIDSLSQNNILYAHGLVNNEMFGSLRRTTKSSWYSNKNNHIIKIVTSNNNNQLWQVFSTYTIEPEEYYITTKFNENEFSEFINTIIKRSVYNYNVEVDVNDKILTLSSCYNNQQRMVLHAKLIK